MMTDNIGIYIHVPFCRSRCPYCDFYSFATDESSKKTYLSAILSKIKEESESYKRKADSLFLGGGTPSQLPAGDISRIVSAVKEKFLTDVAEITIECNPYDLSYDYLREIHMAGVNRISMGMQSANDNERRLLGRRSSRAGIASAIESARHAGFDNISLDIMLGIPNQTEESLMESLNFCVSMDIQHISAYILKIEENTYFAQNIDKLNLPSDDEVADYYLLACEFLDSHFLKQYEISNFAKEGFKSRHNLKYWNCLEYLGIGPSAHSYIDGRRFYYEKDFDSFVNDGLSPVFDGEGGSFTEYAMLGLRLCEGISDEQTFARFGHKIPESLIKAAEKYIDKGFMSYEDGKLAMTRNGFLISNSILADIL